MSQPDLLAVERQIDAEIANLPILSLPVRAIFTSLHFVVDLFSNGSRFLEQPARQPEIARSVAARVSYLIPILSRCRFEPTGASAKDALDGYREVDPSGSETRMLLSYGRFCEIMPEVRRGYHAVRKPSDDQYILDHVSESFAASEAKDIIISELALPFGVDALSLFSAEFDKIVATSFPMSWGPASNNLTLLLFNFHLAYSSELPLVTAEGFVEATGVSRQKFHRFRAALLAIADLCDGIAAALTRRMKTQTKVEQEAAAAELLEWISVFWTDDFFVTIASQCAELSIEEWHQLASFFTENFLPRASSVSHAKEGFCPPLLRLPGGFLFNPFVLKMFLSERNFLVCLNRLDKTRFDSVVSGHMEPQLINDAVDVLGTFSDLELIKSYEWDKGVRGEIDLLVYSPQENAVLHVQAKAAIPPEGARMVKATEIRVAEGLAQLSRLRILSPDDIDAVISKAVGKSVTNIVVVDVLLARACFGTERAWSQASNVCLATLPLLQLLVYRLTRDSLPFSVRDFPRQITQIVEQLVKEAVPTWKSETLQFQSATVVVPSLEFDPEPVARARINARVAAEKAAWRTSRTN